ncbi:unnamed protein product [Paramecium pentaurelia]|uniref:Uncharacterized protein n=1 Tax=Paramecium pentaurelia TaxID=43138 RepID=A0A8S1YEZ3_9CILI|nr:unnamed protein product [Paramecium pentaurelia]
MFIWFFHFHFLGIIVEAYHLQHFVTSTISGDEGWLIKNPYNGATVHTYDCGGNIIFGGYQKFGCYLSTKTQIMKYFMLPPHYKVRIDINFWKIDDWPSAQLFYIIVDQWTQSWYFTDNTGSNICADTGSDYSSSQYNDFPLHTLNSIIVELYSDCSTTNFWGLTNFSITLNECYLGCQFCLDSTTDCIMWILWKSFFQLQNLDDGLEGWIKNKFPTFTSQTNDFQLKMLVLNQRDSAITYLTLPDHLSLIIQFRIEYLSAMPITVRVYIDNERKYGLTSYKKQVDYRTLVIDDTKNQIKLDIYSVDGTVGIRELSVILRGPINLIQLPFDGCFAKQESCLEGCTFCVKGECLMCDTSWDYNSLNKNCEPSCGDKIITGNELCDDGNDIPYDGCHECQFSCPKNCKNCQFGQCQTCDLGYHYSNGICNRNYEKLPQDQIQVDYNQRSYFIEETEIVICGDGKVQQDEQCDDGNNISNDGCYNCNFQCTLNCQECNFGVCQYCSPTYELINGKCLEFQTQFRFLNCIRSDINENQISDVTYCDDYDITYNLEISGIQKQNIVFQCPQYCEICENGKCKKCLVDYFLLNNLCITQITKGALLFKDELQLSLIEIGCYKCNDSCQIQCLQCQNSYCFSCIQGWQLIDGICQQICGDNQVAILSKEECDSDLNDCVNCKFICPENCQICINSKKCLICEQPYVEINNECQLICLTECQKCINGICHDNCLNGEINIDGICYSICGDGIKQQKEQCDDGNNIQFDGCFNCEYSCPKYCLNCEEGICLECQQYFQLIQNTCYDGCGSGIKSYDEECDDQNINNVDGCSSNCKIEIDYKCQDKTNSYTECQYFESPYMIVQFLNQTYNKYYIQVLFSQKIYFRDNYDLKSLFEFSVNEASSEDFATKLVSNYKPVINQILNFQFQIEIEFFLTTNNSLISLQISLLNEVFNQYDMKLINPSEQILLKQYTKLSQSDVEKTKQLSQYQEIMIIAQGIGSVVVLISGNFQFFVEILDNLQYQSYLKYTNIIYPENLYIFFETTNLISIIPILDLLKISQFYQIFQYQDFIESYAKLKFYNLNAHLITNLQFFVIQVILTFIFVIILKVICQILFRLIHKIQFQHLLIFKLRSLKSKILIKSLNWIYIFFHFIMIFVYQFYQDGGEGLLLANAWDLLFKTFSYLESSSNQDIISRIQTIISYLTLAIAGKFIISSLKRGFTRKNYNLNYRYKAVYLLKQFFFCYFLICFQNHSLIQLIMLTTTNMIYLCLLIFVEFNLEKLDKIQIIILEISIITFTLTSIFHLTDYNYLISEENKIILGFAQIYILISGLLGIFIKQIIIFLQKIKHRCLQYKKKEEVSQRVSHLIFETVK